MPFTEAGKNLMLDSLTGANPGASLSHVSLHSGDPGEAGLFELSGGGYLRQSLLFAMAAGGAIDSGNQPAFDVPAGATVTHVGFWSAATGGTFLAYAAVPIETFGAAGSYALTDVDMDLNA